MNLFLMALSLAADALAADAHAPSLRIEKAVYTLDPGVVQVAFVFTNPTDKILYLDCQGKPKSAGKAGILHLSFGNPEDTSSDQADVPARVEPGQVYAASRKLYAKTPGRENPSIALDPSPFAKVQIDIAYYPERTEGEGVPYLKEKAAWVKTQPAPMTKTGKRPPPPPVRRTRTYVPGAPAETTPPPAEPAQPTDR